MISPVIEASLSPTCRVQLVFLPDQRFENVPDDSDEVCRMNDVQSFQVLLVSEGQTGKVKLRLQR